MTQLPIGFTEIPMPPIVHFFAGGTYAKQVYLEKAGTFIVTHKHIFDHLSIVATGSVKVITDGVDNIYTAPTAINIKAGVEHQIITLTDNVTWYCIHAIPDGYEESGEYIDDVLIQRD